jgi:phospholipase/carboxylesterase
VEASGTRGIGEDQVLWSAPQDRREGRPLLVLLHGHGMDEHMGADVRHRLPPDLVLASIRGPLRVRSGYGWFPLDTSLRLDQIDSAAHAVLRWVQGQTRHPSVGVLGFSQGSSIGLQCMRLDPELFDYGVVLSGFAVPLPLPGDGELARRRPPVFSGRGDADPLIPTPLVAETGRWLAAHTTLTARVYPGLGHGLAPAEIDDLAAFLAARLADAAGGGASGPRSVEVE